MPNHIQRTLDCGQCTINCGVNLSERYHPFNTLRPRLNAQQISDKNFKCILLNENKWISIKISLELALKGPINNSIGSDNGII